MLKLRVRLLGYGEDTPTSAPDIVSTQARPRVNVDLTDYVTHASWAYMLTAPYESASLEVVIPYLRLQELFRLGAEIQGGGLALHASGWLEISEEGAVQSATGGENMTVTLRTHTRRFLGPVESVSVGTSAGHNGAIMTARVQVRAVSWLSVATRTLRLSAVDALTRGSLISVEQWAQLVEDVVTSSSGDLGTSLTRAWHSMGAFYKTPVDPEGTLAGLAEPVTAPSARPQRMARTLTPVQGYNLTQVQVPPLRVSVWGLITSTWQASPELVELFPTWHEGNAYLVYRLKPLQPSLFAQGGAQYFARLRGKPTPLPAFVNIAQRSEATLSLLDPQQVNLQHTSARGNFIEVTSPFSGVTQAAGVSCDPVALLDDIERHGLHEVTLQYPYFRANEGAEESVRSALNEMVDYAAALYAESHAYATAQVGTAYAPHVLQGEWALFNAHVQGDMRFMLGYVTQVQHRVDVLPSGAVQARSTVSLERVSVKGRDLAAELETSR
jgi:hypothetical protein